jgi:hypothetical protein
MPTTGTKVDQASSHEEIFSGEVETIPQATEEEEYSDTSTCPEVGMVTLGEQTSSQVDTAGKELVDLKLFKTPPIDKPHVMLSELCIWIGDTGAS